MPFAPIVLLVFASLMARDNGTDWIVEDGLKPGERVVADGLFKIRPGAPVNPKGAK